MPNAYGHAKPFYDPKLITGELNTQRNLYQFKNGTVKPKVDDIIVFDGTLANRFGHVAIISNVPMLLLKSFNKTPALLQIVEKI